VALRSALWAGTDQAYKSALAAYAQKQAELKQVQTPPQADDFSKEKPVILLETPLKLALDQAMWSDRVARASGLYRTDASVRAGERDVQYCSASFHTRVTTTWLVTSEGTIVRKSVARLRRHLPWARSCRRMRLDRSYASTGASLKDLDAQETFEKHAVDLIASLTDLRKAPLVEEEYHGPVLLSADASADTLRSLVGSGVTATRPRLGTEARTNGPFASSYHARVLPEFMDVVDDPGLKSYDGRTLIGAYDVDDDGCPRKR